MQDNMQNKKAGTEANPEKDHIVYLDKIVDRLIKAISERPTDIKLHGLGL